MKQEFEASQAPLKPLGKDGEITEWLAVKERADGKVRSMTMREAMTYHDDVIWKFPGERAEDKHTAAHLITGLIYGDKVTPFDYQSTFQAEIIVMSAQRLLEERLISRFDKKTAQNYFKQQFDAHFKLFYAQAMFYRTLLYEILQRRHARGEGVNQTVNDIREELGHSRTGIENIAQKEGIVFERNMIDRNIYVFTVQGLEKEYFVDSPDSGFKKSLPPEGDQFQNFSKGSQKFIFQVFDRVWPAVQFIADQREGFRQMTNEYYEASGDYEREFDFYDYIQMADLHDSMKGVPVPTPMPTIPILPKAPALPVPTI